ncbi:acyltransferase [Caenimonas sedimenti]|uniref:Acyltransferase n=1 Tax=Caenimonas sedimenti TaxID=2596921 RepID=A0A562ZQW7_9BURK|nr:acyltransferase [Caenimonas sedimenti]TWO71000.1 acyltransferase [Caenimonas sedimenti]
MERRHDIDALRAFAFALVILYHVAMYYVAGWHWHLKSPHELSWLQWPMRAMNLWRMDLVFLISGLALGFLRPADGRARLFGQRSLRLLLPLAFGMAIVVPYQAYAQAVANGSVAPGFLEFMMRYLQGGPWPQKAFDGSDFGVTWNHLWYLPYLWCYTALLLLALPWLATPAGLRLRQAFLGLRGPALLLPALPLMAWSLTLWPRFPATHDLIQDGWLHAVYFTLFLYGYWIGTDRDWWREVARLRWALLGGAVTLLALHSGLRAAWPPAEPGPWRLALRCLADLYLWTAILAILGWAHQHLNRPWRWLPWANEQVYPWYMLHQTLIIVLVVWLAPWQLPAGVEALLLVAGTIGGCWAGTAIIRRTGLLRPLFGLKPPERPRCPSPARPADPAARSA